MNRLFVLKDVAYAAKTGGGTIAGANELNVLASGALALLNDKGELLTGVTTTGVTAVDAAKLADSKTFTIAAGRPGGVLLVTQIPRQEIFEFNRKEYLAPVAMVITLGGGTTPLTFTDNEEAVVKVSDVSYTSRHNVQSLNASVTKRVGETASAALDRLIARINQPGSFVTATKVGTTVADFGITITPKDARTTIEAGLGGTFEWGNIATTTAQVYGDGVGEDVYQLEKDFSVELGNGNYIDYTTDHYKQALSTDASANYDMLNFLWEGRHSSPTRSHNVMRNRVVVALPDGSAILTMEFVLALFSAIIGKAYDETVGEEPAADDGLDNDGVAGN